MTIAPDDPLQDVSLSIDGLVRAVRNLGNGNAATEMGALEAHSMKIEDAARLISESLESVASALRDIAASIAEHP